MDKLTPQQRHKNMAAIRSKDTKPEWVVRRGLWRRGFRYRLNSPRLPGHPDLVLRKYRTCIFVNGCFWHGHHVMLDETVALSDIVNSECCKIPKSNREFWALDSLALTLDSIWLTDHAVVRTYPPMEEEPDSMMAAEERRT